MTDEKPKFENWLRPHEALAILKASFPKEDVAKHLLIERLKSGAITAIAEQSTWVGTHPEFQGLSTIGHETWREHYRYEPGFWESGDLSMNFGRDQRTYNNVSARFHGIRFDPGAIHKLAGTAQNRIEAMTAALAQPSHGAARLPEPEDQEKPSVSEANLKRWAELYTNLHGGTVTDTLEFAVRTAKAMFPDNSVSRDRVRKLVGGGRKRGPKADPAK